MTDDEETSPIMGAGNGGRVSARPDWRSEQEKPEGFVDHLQRARERIAELRQSLGDFENEDSDLYLDKWYVEAPPGWTYEWKNHTVFNKEFPDYANALQRNGWSPVPANRHREKLYPGYSSASIIQDGMMLYERPKELTERRRMLEFRKAVGQVRAKEAAISEAPPGTAPRDQHLKTVPRFGHSVGPIRVPD
jgi:hypothetical protein